MLYAFRIGFQFRWFASTIRHSHTPPVIPAKAGIQTPVCCKLDHLKQNPAYV